MRATLSLLVLVLLAACSKSPTSPGHDPTVLITNQTAWPLYFEWRDGQGVVGADTVRGGVEQCVRFTARADSAYWTATITNSNTGGPPATATYTAPWFDPAARPAYHMVVTPASGSPDIRVSLAAAQC